MQVVLAPIAIGMTANKFFPKLVKAILPFAPVVGVVSTCLLVASAVAQVADPIMNAGIGLQVSCCHHLRMYFATINFSDNDHIDSHLIRGIDPCPPSPSSWRTRWVLAPKNHWIRRSEIPHNGH